MSFSFGKTPTTTSNSGFSFGGGDTGKSLSFGTPTVSTTGGFSFGGTPATTAPAPAVNFGFGSNTSANTSFNLSGVTQTKGFGLNTSATTVASTTGFGLGMTPTTSSSTFGGFGITSPNFNLGTPVANTPAVSTPATTTSTNFGFGTTTTSTGFSLGSQTAASSSGFGSLVQPATAASATSAVPTGLNLGVTSTSTTGFSLGSTFATTTTTTASSTPAPTSNFSFGATATATATTIAKTVTPNLTTASTAATTGFSLGSNLSTQSSLTTTTTTTSIPSTITSTSLANQTATTTTESNQSFADLEESINKWNLELDEQEKVFMNQALQLNGWDRLLINNSYKVLELNTVVEKVKQEQQQLNHELDFVFGQQRELEELMIPLENELENIPVTDPDRQHTYQLAENMDSQLKQMSEDLKEIIDHLNETNRTEDSNDPIVQIGRILNAHMNSLQWIDRNTALIGSRLDQVTKLHETHRRDLERSFHLTYD